MAPTCTLAVCSMRNYFACEAERFLFPLCFSPGRGQQSPQGGRGIRAAPLPLLPPLPALSLADTVLREGFPSQVAALSFPPFCMQWCLLRKDPFHLIAKCKVESLNFCKCFI